MTQKECMKVLAARFTKMAESERTSEQCCRGLGEAMKAAGIVKSDKQDFHSELADQHAARADHYDKCATACAKCAKADDGDMVKAIVGSVMSNVNERIGKMVEPSAVRGVFTTESPIPIARAGGPSIPTDLSKVAPEFAHLFSE